MFCRVFGKLHMWCNTKRSGNLQQVLNACIIYINANIWDWALLLARRCLQIGLAFSSWLSEISLQKILPGLCTFRAFAQLASMLVPVGFPQGKGSELRASQINRTAKDLQSGKPVDSMKAAPWKAWQEAVQDAIAAIQILGEQRVRRCAKVDGFKHWILTINE